MIKQLIIIIFVLLSIDGFCQNDQDLFKQLVKSNNIRSQTTIKAVIQNNQITKEEHVYRVDSFDVFGNKVVETLYEVDGNVKIIYQSEFDQYGDLKRLIGQNAKGELTTILEYEISSNGKIRNRYQKEPNGTILIHQKREYDSNGLNTKLRNKGRNGNWYLASEYTYDKDGQYNSIKNYNDKGELLRTKYYKYKKERLDKIYEGKRKVYVEFKYDKLGNLISRNYPKEITGITNGLTVKGEFSKSNKYTYDNDGMKISETTFKDGKIVSFSRFEYQKHGT